MTRGRAWRGFTLIELLITLAIMAVLATLTVPVAQIALQRSREQALQRALLEIRQGLDAYRRASDDGRIAKAAGASGYPASLDQLVVGVVNLRDPRRGKLYFLRRLPDDPMMPVTDPPGSNWDLRSYDSEPDNPHAGADVFDVLSRSTATGLNGTPYRDW
jgi:general secretion pathway protein G